MSSLAAQALSPEAVAEAEAALDAGAVLWQDGHPVQAAPHFRQAYEAAPGYISPQHGAAAYWLGRALLETGAVDDAFAAWWDGLGRLADAGLFDVTLADAFVREVYARQRRALYADAAETYVWLLRSLDAGLTAAQRARITPHLEPLAWILPNEMLSQTGLTPLARPDREGRTKPATPTAGAGEALAAWWRSQDPLPATPQNEGLQEHLERVFYARTRYTVDGVPDDRARIYVRLGKPFKVTKVRFNSQEFVNKVVFRQITLSSFDFPENEFWVYDHIDDAAQYLFVSDLGYYRLGTANDLLPPQLRNGLTTSERGMRKAEAVVRTMEEIYKELALLHSGYAMRYQDAADFAELFDQQEILSQAELEMEAMQSGRDLQDVPRDLSGANPNTPMRTDLLPQMPHSFAQEMIARATYEDGMAAQRREEDVPLAFTDLYQDAERLPVIARPTRFLDEDGTTRTHLFWTLAPEALRPSKRLLQRRAGEGHQPSNAYLLRLATVQQTAAFRNRAVQVNHYQLPAREAAENEYMPAQQVVTRGDTGQYHLALQWDQYWAFLDEGQAARPGAHLKVGSYRFDSLQALRNDATILEMSDLLPFYADAETDALTLDNLAAYPFDRITTREPLGLYFEVYHLTYGPDDRTHFDVAYQVLRQKDRLLRADKEDVTSARTEYVGQTRTAREYILIEPSEWQGADAVTITITITDKHSGRQVERALSFDVVGG